MRIIIIQIESSGVSDVIVAKVSDVIVAGVGDLITAEFVAS